MAKADWDDEGLYLDSIFNFPEESMESWEGDEWDAFASHKLGPIPEDFVIDPTEIAQTTNAPLTPSYPLKSCTTPETYQFDDTDGLYILQPDESNAVQAEGTFRSPDEVQEAYTFPSSDEIQQADTFRSTNEVQEAYTFPSSDEIQEADTFRSPSPVSVLSKRKRSKRARPSGPSQWNLSLPFLNTKRASDAKKANIRRRKTASNQTSSDYANPEYAAELRLTKKCAHCEITKTPQWREGPLGPKTLCNACGVRYRSGRLFPEYRPAASPTFVPSIHSNSHKKVVEMRNRGKHKVDKIEQALPPQIEFNPVFSCLCDHTRL